MMPSTPTPERQLSNDATLHCPGCGHENRINGEWLIRVLARSLAYECPDCGTVIDSRRDQAQLIDGSGGALQFAGGN